VSRLPRLLLVLFLIACGSTHAADDTATRADALFGKGQLFEALPLYEELSAADPQNPHYAESLAFCLVAKFESLPTGPERTALVARARAEAERAEKLGDDSSLLKMMLDRVRNPKALENANEARMQAAEALFAKGDLDGALAAYKAIIAVDPKSYAAYVYAGDVYFRKRSYKDAGEWFAKAIQVDPNRETAYRYWGDALVQSGDNDAALEKFVDAIIAEPYIRTPRAGLSQWAQKNGAALSAPRIALPQAPGGADGKTINVNADTLSDPATGGAWLVYQATRLRWRNEDFKKKFPAEKEYRHSLAEEVMALHTALAVLQDKDKPPRDPNLNMLAQLEADGMLEAYVLIDAPDQGIARDYDAYRNAHREVLHDYVLKYVVKRHSP
jgi:tetratricopeptide (TPR) repeat protein